MDITIRQENIASYSVIRECFIKQIEAMGYAVKDYGTVVESDPIKVETIQQGWLFKKTYHKWFYKIISKIRLHQEDDLEGKYKLYITTPYNEETFKDVDLFIEGLNERLADLKDSLEIIFIKDTKFYLYEENNIPRLWY